MKTVTSKVDTLISKFGEEEKLSLFYFYQYLDDGNHILNGDEFYSLTGLFFEVVGDAQLIEHIKKGSRKLLQSGLW